MKKIISISLISLFFSINLNANPSIYLNSSTKLKKFH